MPAIKLNLKPNLFLRFLYRSEIILKRFNTPITFSFNTRALDRALLSSLSFLVNGCFFVFFLGTLDLLCIFCMP